MQLKLNLPSRVLFRFLYNLNCLLNLEISKHIVFNTIDFIYEEGKNNNEANFKICIVISKKIIIELFIFIILLTRIVNLIYLRIIIIHFDELFIVDMS